MKKLVFSAIAIIAFSGVSMASSKVVKVQKVTILKADSCATLASNMMAFYEDSGNCMSSSQYNAMWYHIYNRCAGK